MVRKDSWVKIEHVILQSEARTGNLPEETKKVPYVMQVSGILQNDAEIGQECSIVSRIGRTHTGRLIEENPTFRHNFGEFVRELADVNMELKREILQCKDE